jgi:predicted RNase H-like HicB family nuclease
MNDYTVFLSGDDEAQVWIAESDDMPGLVLEAKTADALIEEAKLAAVELLELMDIPPHSLKLCFKAERFAVVA